MSKRTLEIGTLICISSYTEKYIGRICSVIPAVGTTVYVIEMWCDEPSPNGVFRDTSAFDAYDPSDDGGILAMTANRIKFGAKGWFGKIYVTSTWR